MMNEWPGNSQDINIFCDYDFETQSYDGNAFEKEEESKEVKAQKEALTNEIAKRSFDFGEDTSRDLKRVRSSVIADESDDAVWSIEDDTFFYPLGICNHSVEGANKSVVLCWSEYCVINFVIKKMINKKQTKTTRVRLNVPQDETIKDVQILEFNTLLLLESGRVNYFSSAKSMHDLPWLTGIRCVGRTLQGFCVIRLTTSDQRLLLEIYEDAVNMGKRSSGIVKHRYDITFDEENIFNCDWKDEKFVVFAIAIDAKNIEFVEALIAHSCSLEGQSEVFVFTVSGNIFVLIPDAANDEMYHIEMIFSYASNVEFIKVDHERKFCLVFLECGSIDIWYMSTIGKRLLHQLHNTGSAYINYSYSDKRAAFYYTDESQVVELKFVYNQIRDRFSVQETHKAISGIVACTWIETIEQLICLDCNNIFHQLNFETEASTTEGQDYDKSTPFASDVEFEKLNALFELTPQRVRELTKKANVIQQLMNLPTEIYQDIDKEYLKQQLLALDEKRNYYAKQLKAQLKFSMQLPTASEKNTVFLYANSMDLCNSERLLALISLEISRNEVFRSSLWRLHVHFGESVHVFSLPTSILSSKIQLVVPLKRPAHALLSNIQLYLYTCLSHTTMHAAIALPIKLVETSENYAELFSPYPSHTERIYSIVNLNDLFARFTEKSQAATQKSLEIEHFLPKNISFEAIRKLFNSMPQHQSEGEENELAIAFLNHKICLSWEKEKRSLKAKSCDAAAIFYLKLYIMLAGREKRLPNGLYELDDYQQMILRHQCTVERCYGALSESGVDDGISDPSRNHRLESLQKMYEKIRNHVASK